MRRMFKVEEKRGGEGTEGKKEKYIKDKRHKRVEGRDCSSTFTLD